MAFRFPLPSSSGDGRAHREEDLSLARLSAQRTASSNPPDSAAAPADTKMDGSAQASPAVSPAPQRRRVVFPDPVALRFLEEDPSVKVMERREVLHGYELYLVEQWACSRQTPTLVIVTYTGDPRHSVVVGVLAVPAEEKDWSPRLRVYFTAIQQYHARPKETPLGELMVTNLSSFPSALTVIPVPDGDFKTHRQIFIVNEDLKRLGCSGRSGMTLSDPTPATQAKFLQLYKTSERIPFQKSVLELVKLCQVALFIFDKLDQEYIDGLLCDVTETAINNWWTKVGSEYYNVEPTDGILGPTTVAALLGTLMGARNRLSWYGAPVAKDVFDIDSTKRGISHFQKAQKLERTRRLDRQTLLKLHSVTARAAAGEGGWGVQRAVKSTVAEIGGKRGEIVIGMVGGREKAGIGDIETTDIDRLIALVSGERAKWLWHGKRKRTPTDHHEHALPDMGNILFGREDTAGSQSAGGGTGRRSQSLPLDEELEAKKKEDSPGVYSGLPPPGSATSIAESPGDKDALRKTVFKSVAGKVSDARSGFGRIRDAVGGGLRGHSSRPSKDETHSGLASPSISTLAQSSAALSTTGLSSPVAVGRAFTWKNKPDEYANAFRKERESESGGTAISSVLQDGELASKDSIRFADELPQKPAPVTGEPGVIRAGDIRRELVISDASISGSVADETDLQGPILAAERSANAPLSHLQRRHSVATSRLSLQQPPLNENRWPRRMSFSEAEVAVLRWEEIVDVATDDPGGSEEQELAAAMARHASAAELLLGLYGSIAGLQRHLSPWVGAQLAAVSALDASYARHAADLAALHEQLGDAAARARDNAREMVAEERAHAAEAVKDVEALAARLEYEIDALAARARDVEDGVAQFEAQVGQVEERADELKRQLETESWMHWAVRTLTGIGTGPNITRERS